MGRATAVYIFFLLVVLVVIGGSMGVGLPDWYNIKKQGAVSALGDLGELAVRLGSIVSFDRRGDVVWMDDFEHTLNKWNTYTPGTGDSAGVSKTRARNGDYSCEMVTGTEVGSPVEINSHLAVPPESGYGFEVSFTLGDDHTYFYTRLYVYTGSARHEFTLRYDVAAEVLQHMDEDGNYTNLSPGIALRKSDVLFNTLKFVVDLESEAYVWARLNEGAWAMAGIAGREVAVASAAYFAIYVGFIGTTGVNVTGYVDDVIITQNEP